MTRPRWLAQLLASLGGYFWLPCPICGEPFAGFEWGESVMLNHHSGEGVCSKPSCCKEARRRNDNFRKNNPLIVDLSRYRPQPWHYTSKGAWKRQRRNAE